MVPALNNHYFGHLTWERHALVVLLQIMMLPVMNDHRFGSFDIEPSHIKENPSGGENNPDISNNN